MYETTKISVDHDLVIDWANVLGRERCLSSKRSVGFGRVHSVTKYGLISPLVVIIGVGCSNPDSVRTFKSPQPEVYYTVEDYYEGGPVSDTNRVYAHFDHGGKTARLLVLEGGNLTVKTIVWNGSYEAVLCLDGGTTTRFRNEVTLFAGGASVSLHNYLRERCEGTRPTSIRAD